MRIQDLYRNTMAKGSWDPEWQKLMNSGVIKDGDDEYMIGEKYSAAPGPDYVSAGSFNQPGAFRQGQQSNTTIYGWKKSAPAPAPAPAPAAPAPPPAPAASTQPSQGPGNPALGIPGIDIRLTGEQVGVTPASSKARRDRSISSGSSRLTIPRSSGASGLNIG